MYFCTCTDNRLGQVSHFSSQRSDWKSSDRSGEQQADDQVHYRRSAGINASPCILPASTYGFCYFQTLLPKGCVRSIDFSSHYEASWRCNFLGLAPGSVLPPEAELYVILDVIDPEVDRENPNQLLGSDFASATVESQFLGYNFLLSGQLDLPSTCTFHENLITKLY